MMNSRFSGRSGFGSWFGNVPSGSKKQRTASTGKPVEDRREHRAGHAVRGVDDDAQRPDGRTSTNERTWSTNAG